MPTRRPAEKEANGGRTDESTRVQLRIHRSTRRQWRARLNPRSTESHDNDNIKCALSWRAFLLACPCFMLLRIPGRRFYDTATRREGEKKAVQVSHTNKKKGEVGRWAEGVHRHAQSLEELHFDGPHASVRKSRRFTRSRLNSR